jgi:hypothetical protein
VRGGHRPPGVDAAARSARACASAGPRWRAGFSRRDIVNLTQLHIYEIKPATTIDAGLAQAQMYLGLLEKGGVTMSLGPSTAPGTHGQLPAPDGVFIFYSPRPGVIAYQYRHGRLVPVPAPERQDSPDDEPVWQWQLEPVRKDTATWIIAVGTAALLIVALITAPASG